MHINEEKAEGPKSGLPRTTMMVLAVTLHNIPEGMAVGIVYAGLIAGSAEITAGGALALALGSNSELSGGSHYFHAYSCGRNDEKESFYRRRFIRSG